MSAKDFREKGFLSDYVYEYRDEIRGKYAGEFSECEEISFKAHQLFLKTSVKDTDRPLLCSLLFFDRTIRTAQAAIRLCEIGLVQEAQILVRTSYETVLHASALLKQPDIFKKIGDLEVFEDTKQARAMLDDIPSEELTELDREDLEEFLHKDGKKNFTVYSSAAIAGMENLYSVVYRSLSSSAVHATFRSLDRSLDEEESGLTLYVGPTENQLIFTLSLIAQCLNISMQGLNDINEKSS